MADDIFRGNAPAVEALYLFYLSGAQSHRISKDFIDRGVPYILY
jgi:hypothetical protein